MIFDTENFRKKNRNLAFLLIILVAVISLGVMLPTPEHRHNHSDEGIPKSIESFEFEAYLDEHNGFSFEDKPYVLIEFFTLNCPYCKASIPDLNKINQHKDISVVAYIMETSKKRIAQYAEQNNVKYPISRGSVHLYDHFNPVAVPISFLIDTKTKEVKKHFLGVVKYDKIVSEL